MCLLIQCQCVEYLHNSYPTGDSSSNMTRITILLEDLNDNAPVITNGGVTLASVSELVGQVMPVAYLCCDSDG